MLGGAAFLHRARQRGMDGAHGALAGGCQVLHLLAHERKRYSYPTLLVLFKLLCVVVYLLPQQSKRYSARVCVMSCRCLSNVFGAICSVCCMICVICVIGAP